MRTRGFTLIELLVVISIIALLIGILLPALGMARTASRSLKSMVNTRSWGQGAVMFSDDHDGMLPWDGEKSASHMNQNFAEALWWANAIPRYEGQSSYADLPTIPLPGSTDSIFIDPSAEAAPTMPATGWAGGGGTHFYFNYVYNAELDDTDSAVARKHLSAAKPDEKVVYLHTLKRASATILMLEMRSTPSELPSTDPFYGEDLNRQKSDWQRFAARHDRGGHFAFCDGHAAYFKNEDVTTPGIDAVTGAANCYNKPDLIWDPFGNAN